MEMRNVLIHHVFFWLKNPDSLEDKAMLVNGLRKLSAIKAIQHFQIGQPAATFRDVVERSYSISWLLVFADAADQESYQTDQVHLEFIELCGHLWNAVKVHDTIELS